MSNKITSGKELENIYTSDDILGKEVIDSEGNFLGVAEKLFIDKTSMDFIAIAVDKGLVKKGLVIGRGYIERIAEYAIFLKTPIFLELKGSLVFDKDGEKIGKINQVVCKGNQNSIKELIVSVGFNKIITIPAENISTINKNTILNKSKIDLNL